MVRDLATAQNEMKNRPQHAPVRHIAGLKEARALRRVLRKRKRSDRARYLLLLAEKRTLKRELREAYKDMLQDFRTLCGTMREAEQVVRGALGDREKHSAAFLRGLEAGREEARMQTIQKQLDQKGNYERKR